MKFYILPLFLIISFSKVLLGQGLNIQFPNLASEIPKPNYAGFSMCEKYDLIQTDFGYTILSTYHNYYLISPYDNPFVTNLDKNRNITYSGKLEDIQTHRGQNYRFVKFLVFGQKAYIIYRYIEGGVQEDYISSLILGQISVDKTKFIKLNDLVNPESFKKAVNGNYYSSTPSINGNFLEIDIQEFSENINDIKKYKVSIKIPTSKNNVEISRIEYDYQGNAHIIFYNGQRNCYAIYKKNKNELKEITNMGRFCQLGFDKFGNTYILYTGGVFQDVYNNDCFTIIKFNTEGMETAREFISIPIIERFRYLNNEKIYITKEKGADGFFNTNASFKNCRFGVSEDGSIGGFYISEANRYSYEYYVPSYEYNGFHWITFNTTTMEHRILTIGKDFWVERCNLGYDFIFSNKSSLTLLYYNNSKNVNPDMSSTDMSKYNRNFVFNESSFSLYTNTVDNKLNSKIEKVTNPIDKSIIKLPPVQLSENEYFIFGSENKKFNKYRVGYFKIN